MMADFEASSFKATLIHLSDILKDEDLKKMKYMCRDIIKLKELEKIVSPLDLWQALEQREKLGPENLTFLKKLLKECTAGNLVPLRCVENYERVHVKQNLNHGRQQPQQPLQEFNGPPPQYVYITRNEKQNFPVAERRYRGPDLKGECSLLADRLGKDWKFFVRTLGLSDEEIDTVMQDHQRVREQIHQCLRLWQLKEQQTASRAKLVACLRDRAVQRHDIALDMEKM